LEELKQHVRMFTTYSLMMGHVEVLSKHILRDCVISLTFCACGGHF
jgi:hypothetical protein